MQDLNISDLEVHPFNQEKQNSYCYLLLYKGVIVYIGETCSIDSRMIAHTSNKVFDEIRKIPIPGDSKKDRLKMEGELIRRYNPILSHQHGCKPKDDCIVIGSYVFMHSKRHIFEIVDGKLYQDGNIRGYIARNKKRLVYRVKGEFWYYSFGINKWDCVKIKPDTKYKWDDADFMFKEDGSTVTRCVECRKVFEPDAAWKTMCKECFIRKKNKEVLLTSASEKALVRLKPIVPINSKFKAGKYRGESFWSIVHQDKGYINWYLDKFKIPELGIEFAPKKRN